MNISAFTSLCLKLVGVIFILSSLLDYLTIVIPPNWQSTQWGIGVISGIVDRGIVPLVGMVLIVIGYWIDASAGTPTKPSKLDLRMPTFVLAAILGLMFLLFVPLHLINLNELKATALEQIEQGAGQGEQQIQGFLQQINSLSQNPQLLDQAIQQRTGAIETGQVQGRQLAEQQLTALRQQRDQLQQLRDLAKKPSDFKKRIDQIKTQLETQLAERKRQAESRANTEAIKQGLRIGLSSLMLAIGYVTIGWFGLRGLGSAKPKRTGAPRR